ncbi:hypothetical protein [Streptomyces sp. NPDC059949]|uniref:hypothetical protein n=1 Tax=Streptomyces sp. NPDC059949 TaxID=3347013 RepID=UPI00365752C3
MSLSLAGCLEAVARLLDACGPLEPLRLCLSARDVQAEVCASGAAATLSLGRLAGAAGVGPVTSSHGVPEPLTADLSGDLVLVAAAAPPAPDEAADARVTSTRAAAELLRTLASWAGGLDQDLAHTAELWVDDRGHAYTVRLLTTAGQSDDLEAAAAAAGQGLARFRTWRTDSGIDGVGRLPCGRTVHVGVVALY